MQFRKILTWTFCSAFTLFLSSTYAESGNMLPDVQNDMHPAAGYFFSVGLLPPVAGSMNFGYQFNRNFGLQAGVLGIWESTLGLDFDTATIYDVAMRGVLPLGNRGEMFGKLGVGVINGQVQVSLPVFGTIKQTGESVGPTFGLGFGFYFTPHWVGTLEYSGIYSVGSKTLKDGVKGVPMIGVAYHFAG